MSETVAQELVDKKPLLLQKIESNEDLANVLMALLGRLVLECTSKGFKLNAIRFSDLSEKDGRFQARISYLQNSLFVPTKTIQPRNDFISYLASKNSALVAVLRVNEHVAKLFETLVARIEQYAFHKSIPFNELQVLTNGAFISRDNDLVITVGKEDVHVTESRGLKKFFGIN